MWKYGRGCTPLVVLVLTVSVVLATFRIVLVQSDISSSYHGSASLRIIAILWFTA